MSVTVKIAPLRELSHEEFYKIVLAREEVFVLEQKITLCPEVDEVDLRCIHILVEEDGALVAYARCFKEESEAFTAHIGRVLTTVRGRGLGALVMREALGACRNLLGAGEAVLHAQEQVVEFYKKCGFHVTGGSFDECGIVHYPMSRTIYEIRPAVSEDIPGIMPVLAAAKGIMRESGNSGQWVNGYPSEADIRADITSGIARVVLSAPSAGMHGGRIAGYFAFMPSPEPSYARIFDGKWLDDSRPYHVMHRIGSYPDARGVLSAMLDYAFSYDDNIRVDTHADNLIMQRLLSRFGFTRCGTILLSNGSPRLAYQRLQ